MKSNVLHLRIDGITHEATEYSPNLYTHRVLVCEVDLSLRMPVRFRKLIEGQDVGLAAPVDCMACLVYLAAQ